MKIPVKNCSSCGACANVCAHGAITMMLNNEGFYRPVVDPSKCVKCGLCEKICPWENEVFNPNGSSKAPKTVAAYALNDDIRLQSSSGGVFTILAENVLDDGGVVAGVAQLSSTRFGHIVVDNKADLAKLRGSKYVQADLGTIYRDVRTLLKAGRKVLFSGTPCQVAALYAVLGNQANSANLFTVDVVCHGVPSVKVFEKYIKELECDKSAMVLKTYFRDKSKGWRLFSMTSSLKMPAGNSESFSQTLREDVFMRLFLRNLCLNKSCVACRYGKIPRIADITLGDYWNITDIHPEMDDNKGTSVVLLNTVHGELLFNSISNGLVLCESSLEKAVVGNPCIVRSSRSHRNRARFFENLNKYTLEELIQKCDGNLPLHWRFYCMVRGFLGRVKLRITNRLRK